MPSHLRQELRNSRFDQSQPEYHYQTFHRTYIQYSASCYTHIDCTWLSCSSSLEQVEYGVSVIEEMASCSTTKVVTS